jgi:SH3-like domain-containing protein
MRLKIGAAAVVAVAVTMAVAGPGSAVAQDTKPPYWASLDADEAILRRGPSQQMRALWQYQRPGLPVKILAIHEDWRRIEEPDGTTGWMHRSLLSGQRTAIVTAAVAPMRVAKSPDAAIAYRAEAGVIGRISDCGNGWCDFDVLGRRGFIATDAIWGDEALQ